MLWYRVEWSGVFELGWAGLICCTDWRVGGI